MKVYVNSLTQEDVSNGWEPKEDHHGEYVEVNTLDQLLQLLSDTFIAVEASGMTNCFEEIQK